MFNIIVELYCNTLIKDLTKNINIQQITFDYQCSFKEGDLPQGIVDLEFLTGVYPISSGLFPNTLKQLYLGEDSGPEITKQMLPLGLTNLLVDNNIVLDITSLNHLTFLKSLFLYSFENPLDTPLPKSLEDLTLSNFNQPIHKGVLPLGLKTFMMGDDFDQDLYPGMFPDTLTELGLSGQLDFETHKDQIHQILPKSLTKLKCLNYMSPFYVGFLPESLERITMNSQHENKVFPASLPNNLKTLIFGKEYKTFTLQRDVIPPSVTYLSLPVVFDQEFIDQDGFNILPPNLTYLAIGGDYRRKFIKNSLPNSLKTLWLTTYKLSFEPNVLPNSIHTLFFDCSSLETLKPNVIPPSVTKLIFLRGFNAYIEPNALPNSITQIVFRERYRHVILPGVLPNSLSSLQLSVFDLTDVFLPNNITHLTIELHKDQCLFANFIPLSVKKLLISGSSLRDSLKKEFFPPNLTFLKVAPIHFPLEPGMFPPNLHTLDLGSYFNQSININSIPPSVKYLCLPKTYDLKKANFQSTTIPILGTSLSYKENNNNNM
ncbi:hypothetical protein CYY_007963 [Polysphondylium violaceum]|uniref:FNIP repeat-containing protein n=1 Tax=Polysphondylium violaceum TaxID=133409 RepID=A0A8J4PWB3_9MYCE|nr:hypothetical protein CYY_007963 [Polysphondylium violaceum]